MKKSLFLILFAFVIANAQNQRFVYEYSFTLDSTNTENLQKEMLVLDVNPNESKFYSYDKFKSDSLLIIEIEKQKHSDSEFINYKPTYKGKINYTISKDYPDFKNFLHMGIGADEYKVSDDRKMVWKINSEKQKIGEFVAQKAETEMYGRKWIAWFTTEIPIQDGPYKFHGLPGLIVKIEDLTKTHSFELKGISNNSDTKIFEAQKKLFNAKEIPITYVQYKKMFLELQNDLTKSLREMISRSGTEVKIFSPDGTEIKPADILRKRELDAKEERKKNNNPLELDLQK